MTNLRRIVPALVLGVALGGGLLFAGEEPPTSCDPGGADKPAAKPEGEAKEGGEGHAALPKDVTVDDHGDPKGVHRYHRWSEKIGQGAQPEGEEAFANLKRLGFTTIVSVDGSMPDVETAAKYGLRYVHIPIGYDGVPRDAALKMVKAVQLSEGPVFFHCHHGKHRGPAGCAMPAIALEGLSHEAAVERLKVSKTSPDYAGLYRDVAAFAPPTKAELDAITEKDLPSVVKPEGIRSAMVSIDERFEHLKAAQKEAFVSVTGHPDIAPAHEALMLMEGFREMARLQAAQDLGDVYVKYSVDSEAAATRLGEAIKAKDAAAAGKEMEVLANLCSECHRDYRN